MAFRILSREELNSLTTDAIDYIYSSMAGCTEAEEVIEKTLLQAMIISRIEQCKIDSDGLSFLLERIRDNDDAVIFGAGDGEFSPSRKSC